MSDAKRGLGERFPALGRLRVAASGRRIPFVQQMEAADCGAACLAMVLGLHGRHVSLRDIRRVVGSGRGGVTAESLLDAAHGFGLRGRGVSLEPDELEHLPPGSVLHWGFNHFVVLERVTRKGVWIVDPSAGPRLIPHHLVDRLFTGVALSLEPGDGFETGGKMRGGLAGYRDRLRAHRGVLLRIVAISLMVQLFGLSLPLLTGVLVDEVVPHADLDLLAVLGAGLLGVVVFHFLASLIRGYLLVYLRTLFDAQLGLDFVDHLVSLPYGFFLERPTGDLLERYHSNHRVREILTSSALSTLFDGMLVGLYLVVLMVVSRGMGSLVLGLGLLQVVVFLVTRRRYRELASQDLEVRSRSHSQLVEIISGIETLKALGSEGRSVERWSHRFVDELNVALTQGKLTAWTSSLRSALSLASPLVILLFGGYLVVNGDLRLGTMLAMSALATGFLGPLGNLVSTGLDLQEVRSHLDRIHDVMTTPPENDTGRTIRVESLTGEITLERVSFHYRADQPVVLDDVSLRIRAGQKVAIVGKSGAGKTTLARLIVGLYPPNSGRVCYDGIDLAGVDTRSVRARIGVVSQDAHVFGTSIRENIALGDPNVSPERIIEASRLAELHDEILGMSVGYDMPLVDGGASLSGGQRQRVALARALARRPAILLLDEATSDLDTVTERKIMDNLSRLGCTRIVIAHRLSTIADADVILLLEAGRLAEVGTHRELLARKGIYAELVAAQADLGA